MSADPCDPRTYFIFKGLCIQSRRPDIDTASQGVPASSSRRRPRVPFCCHICIVIGLLIFWFGPRRTPFASKFGTWRNRKSAVPMRPQVHGPNAHIYSARWQSAARSTGSIYRTVGSVRFCRRACVTRRWYPPALIGVKSVSWWPWQHNGRQVALSVSQKIDNGLIVQRGAAYNTSGVGGILNAAYS